MRGAAQTKQLIVVRSASPEPDLVSNRLILELNSNGYAAQLQEHDPSLACGPGDAWITLASAYENRDALVATICFKGATVVTSGSGSDSPRFAVTTAEALNGLRAAPPPPVTARPSPSPSPPPSARDRPAPPDHSEPWRARHSLSLTETLILVPGGFPVLWGSALGAEFGLGRHQALLVEGFYPVARAEFSSPAAEMRAGFAFLRVGIVQRHSLGQFALSGSLLAGTSYTWVEATASAPYIGGSASTWSALLGLGLQAGYPERGPVFALGAARASMLLPAVHFALPEASPPALGPLLFEASIGVGVRL